MATVSCKTNADCKSDELCTTTTPNPTCIKNYCADSNSCTVFGPQYLCSLENNTCIDGGCKGTDDCIKFGEDNFYCNLLNKACMSTDCSSIGDCNKFNPSYLCNTQSKKCEIGDFCVPGSTKVGDVCPSGKVCSLSTVNDKHYCTDAPVTNKCDSLGQCDKDTVCDMSKGECVTPDYCSTDKDCGEGYICSDYLNQKTGGKNVCLASVDCTTSEDCGSPYYYCKSDLDNPGYCSSQKCSSDSDCKNIENSFCDTQKELCVRGCRNSNDCNILQYCDGEGNCKPNWFTVVLLFLLLCLLLLVLKPLFNKNLFLVFSLVLIILFIVLVPYGATR